MLSDSYEVVTGREPYMLRTYLLALLVQMPAVNLLEEFGYLHVTIPLNFGFATAAAGFVFGIGMGDNVLHGLSGLPILAISSIIFMICSFAGVWAGVRLNWLR